MITAWNGELQHSRYSEGRLDNSLGQNAIATFKQATLYCDANRGKKTWGRSPLEAANILYIFVSSEFTDRTIFKRTQDFSQPCIFYEFPKGVQETIPGTKTSLEIARCLRKRLDIGPVWKLYGVVRCWIWAPVAGRPRRHNEIISFCIDGTKCLIDTNHNWNPNQTVTNDAVRLKETLYGVLNLVWILLCISNCYVFFSSP